MAANGSPLQVSVTHKCKHTVAHDLANIPAYDRKARAEWLAKKPCTDCWIARNKKRATTAWLKQKNQAELEVAMRRAKLAGLRELTGSDSACAWGTRARDAALARVREAYAGDAAGFSREVLAPAKRVVTASWWIGHHALSADVFVPALRDAVSSIDRWGGEQE